MLLRTLHLTLCVYLFQFISLFSFLFLTFFLTLLSPPLSISLSLSLILCVFFRISISVSLSERSSFETWILKMKEGNNVMLYSALLSVLKWQSWVQSRRETSFWDSAMANKCQYWLKKLDTSQSITFFTNIGGIIRLIHSSTLWIMNLWTNLNPIGLF